MDILQAEIAIQEIFTGVTDLSADSSDIQTHHTNAHPLYASQPHVASSYHIAAKIPFGKHPLFSRVSISLRVDEDYGGSVRVHVEDYSKSDSAYDFLFMPHKFDASSIIELVNRSVSRKYWHTPPILKNN